MRFDKTIVTTTKSFFPYVIVCEPECNDFFGNFNSTVCLEQGHTGRTNENRYCFLDKKKDIVFLEDISLITVITIASETSS